MKILEVDTQRQKAVIELDRSEVGTISKLMCEAKQKGQCRAHFFLLYEMLSHGAFDGFALHQAGSLLYGGGAGDKQEAGDGEA